MQKRHFYLTYLVALHVLSLIPLLFFYAGAVMAMAMSFDSGIKLGAIAMDLAGIILPALLYGLPVYFSYRFYRRQKYRAMFFVSLINWFYLLLFCYYFLIR